MPGDGFAKMREKRRRRICKDGWRNRGRWICKGRARHGRWIRKAGRVRVPGFAWAMDLQSEEARRGAWLRGGLGVGFALRERLVWTWRGARRGAWLRGGVGIGFGTAQGGWFRTVIVARGAVPAFAWATDLHGGRGAVPRFAWAMDVQNEEHVLARGCAVVWGLVPWFGFHDRAVRRGLVRGCGRVVARWCGDWFWHCASGCFKTVLVARGTSWRVVARCAGG